jgi:type IV secretion system protein TrbG
MIQHPFRPLAIACLLSVHPAAVWAKPARGSSAALATVNHANRIATVEPVSTRYLSGVQLYSWSDGSIYRLFASPERVSDIALQPGETLISVAAGDTARWIIGDTESGAAEGRQKHILVKPGLAGLETNLVIATDRRTYHLALVSTVHSAMSAVSWTYPADSMISLKAAGAPAVEPAPTSPNLDIEHLDFNYRVSGDAPVWRPVRAFDDGRRTFVEFPAGFATSSAPPLFLIDDKGGAALVNYRVQGRFYVVDRLFDVAELRLGEKHQTIVRIARLAAPQATGRSS